MADTLNSLKDKEGRLFFKVSDYYLQGPSPEQQKTFRW